MTATGRDLRPESGDFGDLVYPLGVLIGALPFGLIGGLIGMSYPGTKNGWAPCWP